MKNCNPNVGQFVLDLYTGRKTKVMSIVNELYFVGKEHEPVSRHEFLFPLPKKI